MTRWSLLGAALGLCGCPGFGSEVTSVFTEVPERPTYVEHIDPIMANYCDDCHGVAGSQSREPFVSDSYADGPNKRAGVFAARDDIAKRVLEKDPSPMPPAGERPMSAVDRQVLEKWLELGAPER